MKTNLTLVIALFLLCTAKAQKEKGIQFIEVQTEEDMAALDKKAIAENKIIFIDCYTSWCGPCKWMSKDIFTNDTVATFYNKNFLCVKMDMENGIGVSSATKYQVRSFPTFLFIKDGEVIHRSVGARNVKTFVALGETALNPEKRIEHFTKQYQQGNREASFIRAYLKEIHKANMPTKEAADWYFITQSKQLLLTTENFEMMELFVNSYTDTVFDFMLNNREKYIELVGKEKVDEKISNVFQQTEIYHYENDSSFFDERLFKKLASKIKQTDFVKKEELLANLYITYYYEKKDWKKYVEQVTKYVNTYQMKDATTLNNFAWAFYENPAITDKGAMEQALNWAQKSVELDDKYYNNDTYAAVLYKCDKKKEAMEAANKAIELGKKSGEDTSSTAELLEKIKKMR